MIDSVGAVARSTRGARSNTEEIIVTPNTITEADPVHEVVRNTKSYRVIKYGSCNGGSKWKLKGGEEDNNQIEVELEINTSTVGNKWFMKVIRNGAIIKKARKNATLDSSSSSYNAHVELNFLTSNAAGTDKIKAWAKNTVSGEICKTTTLQYQG